jgi:stage II sporulation protein GA (sporulation sigma-E factor processing peptidase)
VGGREYVPVELTYGGKTVSIVALRDSGNTLRDPISGEQVLVVSGEVAERLTGLTQDQLRAPLKTLMCRPVPGLRLIPYRAVGQAGDMLLAMRFDRVKIGNRTQSAVVAFAAEGLGRGDVYQALTGGVI